jgi:long-chain acyl-CoA synthetase
VNIVEEIRLQNHGEQSAARSGGSAVDFNSLFAAVDEIALVLSSHPVFQVEGIPRIGVRFPNGLGYIAVALAVLQSGACFVPIPDELTDYERACLTNDTALHGLIQASDAGIPLPLDLGHAEVVPCKTPPPAFPVADFEALNPAFIRFSSGTTGSSKGVVLSHESLLERILAANRGLKLQAGEHVLWTLPMAHHFAVTIVLYLYHGVTTVLEDSHRPEEIYRAARESKAQLLYGSPFHFAQLAACPEAGPLPHLRLAISTASALTSEVACSFKKKFNLPLTQAYGIIEVGLPILNQDHPGEHPDALGQPLPDYEVQVKDGELFLKGPGMFDAYLVPWQPRKDDWFATGDLVEIHDGTITMKGRRKSVINVAGMKVFPEEIERVLSQHPAIVESRVFAERHPALGSFPAAEIVVAENETPPTIKELRYFCGETLAGYKIPMQVRPVEKIPRTASGKIKRH